MSFDFSGLLRRLNLKATPKRLAILDIMQREQSYLGPDELQAKLLRNFGRVGLPTVYRNLEELARGGILTKILHPNRQLYYFFCPNEAHHHHFVCLDCRTVTDIDCCGVAEAERHIDGEILGHIVQLLGRCRRCLDDLKRARPQ